MTQTNDKETTNGSPETNEVLTENIKVLGSHWNRSTIRKAEVRWSGELGKWEVELIRHLGYFDSAAEAGNYLTSYMNSTEDWFLYRLENGEGALQIMGLKMYEQYHESKSEERT